MGAGELARALCSRVVAAKGEVVEKGHTVEQAQYGRDALAKVTLRPTAVCYRPAGLIYKNILRLAYYNAEVTINLGRTSNLLNILQ